MKHDFSDIELAFESASFDPPSSCSVFLSRKTGAFYYLNDALGTYDELPEDFDTSDDYVEIPHKNELDLGVKLVTSFISRFAPEHSNEVREIFSRKGAYSRYNAFLDRNALRESWHKFEQNQIADALKQWCRENEIDIGLTTSPDAE